MKKWHTGSSFGSSKTLQNLLKPQKESDNLPTRMLRIVFQMAEEALTFIHQNITGFACITAPIPSSWPPWDHSPFGRIHGHNSFNSFNAFMNEKRKLQRTFFHQLLCPSFSKANLSSFPSPLWKYLYIISMSNLWGSPNQDVQWQKFLKKKPSRFDARRHVWCLAPGEAGCETGNFLGEEVRRASFSLVVGMLLMEEIRKAVKELIWLIWWISQSFYRIL